MKNISLPHLLARFVGFMQIPIKCMNMHATIKKYVKLKKIKSLNFSKCTGKILNISGLVKSFSLVDSSNHTFWWTHQILHFGGDVKSYILVELCQILHFGGDVKSYFLVEMSNPIFWWRSQIIYFGGDVKSYILMEMSNPIFWWRCQILFFGGDVKSYILVEMSNPLNLLFWKCENIYLFIYLSELIWEIKDPLMS